LSRKDFRKFHSVAELAPGSALIVGESESS